MYDGPLFALYFKTISNNGYHYLEICAQLQRVTSQKWYEVRSTTKIFAIILNRDIGISSLHTLYEHGDFRTINNTAATFVACPALHPV